MGPMALSGAVIGGLGRAVAGAAIGGTTGSGHNAMFGAVAGLAAGVIGGLAVGNQLDQHDCAEARLGPDRLLCRQLTANIALNGREPVREAGTVRREAQGGLQRM